jgi:hypothetical protein
MISLFRKEDLGLYQNQLNYIQTAWAVGYMVGQIPSNIILTRTRPKYWIPSLEVSVQDHESQFEADRVLLRSYGLSSPWHCQNAILPTNFT